MNRTRLLVILGVLAASAAVAIWVSRNAYWGEVEVPLPLRGEARTNPFYAAQHFVTALGASASWDRTFVAPPRDGVLVMSGWHWGLNAGRRRSVERWVEAGGRLVVDRTVADDPSFQQWSGISIEKDEQSTPRRPGRAFGGCHPLEAAAPAEPDADTLPRILVICGVDSDSYLQSEDDSRWQLSDDDGDQVIRVATGKGTVTVINATPFVERQLFDGDHAALFVAAAGLRAGDQVRFLSETEVPPLLALIWQRGAPVVVLLMTLVVLWLWRIGVRFGPPAAVTSSTRRSLEEQIVATGDFVRRYGSGEPLVAATLRAVQEAASRRIPEYARLSPDQQVAALAKATGVPAEPLARALGDHMATGHRILEPVQTLETARRQLLTRHTRT